ncbi:hypothetical protein BC936DRAFT_139094 [Jimgerdemannia flammicorona]|uniref:Uncharacterized protein n=1 Tax=Jimgerdemannia flammicorona TaxID=994334 RepID=A0A433DHY8_9FUNG|nr:hypothetical protein BC936DRAFT_139094 [Jimgerdemannia flammicorona]
MIAVERLHGHPANAPDAFERGEGTRNHPLRPLNCLPFSTLPSSTPCTTTSIPLSTRSWSRASNTRWPASSACSIPIRGDTSHMRTRTHTEMMRGIIMGLTVPFALAAGLSTLGKSEIVVYGGVAGAYENMNCLVEAHRAPSSPREVVECPEAEEIVEILEPNGLDRETLRPLIECPDRLEYCKFKYFSATIKLCSSKGVLVSVSEAKMFDRGSHVMAPRSDFWVVQGDKEDA